MRMTVNTSSSYLSSSGAGERSPKGNNGSPRGTSTIGTTFQQYRQQQTVRKHPWRTDVKGRGTSRRGAKSWRNLVKAAAPWDEAPCPIIREEDEDLIARSESHDSEASAVSCAISMAEDFMKEMNHRKDDKRNINNKQEVSTKDPLVEALQQRVKKVYQGDHYVVQATGTGRGKKAPAPQNMQVHQRRKQLVRALQDRLQNYYTGHLVSLEAYGKQGLDGLNRLNEQKIEEEAGENDEGSDDESLNSVVSMQSVQSMIVAATILNSVPGDAHSRKQQPAEKEHDDDEYTEYTVESHVPPSPAELMAQSKNNSARSVPPSPAEIMAGVKAGSLRENSSEEWEEFTVQDEPTRPSASTDDDEEWEEETVATEALTGSQRLNLQAHAPHPEADADWDEYTVETATLPQHHQSAQAVQVTPEEGHQDDDDDDQWDEYTVETIADALLALPSAFNSYRTPAPVSSPDKVRQESPGEKSKSSKSRTSIADTVKNIAQDSNRRLSLRGSQYDEEIVSYVDEVIDEDYDDDDYWDDYTVETVADAFASLPRSLQLEFLRTTSTRSAYVQEEQYDDEESECSSQPPPEGAYPEENKTRQPRGGGDDWTEITYEETVHDISGILRHADSAKSASNGSKHSSKKPIITDPTLSSTDSSGSETWNDGRSADSRGESGVREVSSVSSTGNNSINSGRSGRRTRSPPRNLNLILEKDMFSTDLSIVESALRNLAQKADDDLEYRAHIVRSGGILAIVRAMQQNVYNASIQVLACKTLEKIAMDRENRVAIGEVGGVEAVVGAMAEHTGDEYTGEATCRALWVLTSDCRSNQLSVEVAALDTVVSCMRRYAKNPAIQEKAFQTLVNLCLDDEEKLVALSQMGGFVVMSAALVLHWQNPTVKNEAISTLSQLFGRLASYQSA